MEGGGVGGTIVSKLDQRHFPDSRFLPFYDPEEFLYWVRR